MSEIKAGPITSEMMINAVIRAYPQTMGVFNSFNIDSCCGGADSLRTGAEKAGADLADLLEALNAVARGG